MNILEILFGMIPEVLFFSIFLIKIKEIKEKRIIFTLMMVVFYIFFSYLFYMNYRFQISMLIFPIFIMKMLKIKTNIIDVFLINLGMYIALFVTIPLLLISLFVKDFIFLTFINKIICVYVTIKFEKKLKYIRNFITQNWNRNDKRKKKILSLTLRNICCISLNVLMFLGNLILIYCV